MCHMSERWKMILHHSAPSRGEWIMLSIVAIAQLIVFVSFFIQGPDLVIGEADPASYLALARNLLAGNGLSLDGINPSEYRPPVYPFFIASILLFTKHLWFILLIQHIVGLATCLLFSRIARWCMRHIDTPHIHTLAIIVGTLFGLESERLQDVNMLYSETIFLFFFAVSIRFFLYALQHNHRLLPFGASGFFLGLTTLTRPVTQAYIAVYALMLLAWWFTNGRRDAWHGIRGLLIASVVFLAVITPWSLRNKHWFDTYQLSPLASANFFLRAQDATLFQMERAGATQEEVGAYLHARRVALVEEAGVENLWTFAAEPTLWRAGAELIEKNPTNYILFYARGVFRFFADSAFSWVSYKVAGFPKTTYGLFYPFSYYATRYLWLSMYAIICLTFIIFWKKWLRLWPVVFFCLLNIGYHAMLASFGATTRYRLPAVPFMFILGVIACFFFWQWYSQKQHTNTAHSERTI